MELFQSLMLTDIFSSFDPQIYFWGQSLLIWALSILSPLIFLSLYWINTNPYTYIIFTKISFMKTQASRTNSLNLPVFHQLLISLFILLTSLNLLGLFPYVFRTTRHLILTLSFGLPLWLSLILSGIIFSPGSFIARLLPGGGPAWLNPFLVIIETVRTGVQPGTLSFRLAANIRAGHIVITLISVYLIVSFWDVAWKIFLLLLFIQISYLLFEAGIALVQAYIFCLLLSLYSETHPADWLRAFMAPWFRPKTRRLRSSLNLPV